MATFNTKWEQSNRQGRLTLLQKSIKPLFVNKELNEFLASVIDNIKSIDEKIFYLMSCRKFVVQTFRKPDPNHYEAFFDEYQDYFSEIEEEQTFNNPIKWIDAELEFQRYLKSSACEEINESIIVNKDRLTTKEMAAYLRIGVSTLERRVAEGLPQIKDGRRVFYSIKEVTAWLASRNN